MTLTQFLLTFILLTLASSNTAENSLTNHSTCVDDSHPISAMYWTDWHSSNGSLTDEGEAENFTQICTTILATECREKYTHRGLNETDLLFETPCEGGVLECVTMPDNICRDMEMRLSCPTPDDAFLEADFHWSFSELDTGNTRGAIESWNCPASNKKQLVQQVSPIRGNLTGYVREGNGLDKRTSHRSLVTRCGVQTNGLSSLSFEPFVRSCLTDPTCCNSDGITVSFWFHKREIKGGESLPQIIPLRVFRSPYLLITFEGGNLTATCNNGSKTASVRAEMDDNEWEFVTVTSDFEENIKMYKNDDEVGVAVPDFSQGTWSSLEEFWTVNNTSFQVFTTTGSVNVTSSDIRPIAISELQIFYSSFSLEDTKRLYATWHNEDLPGKVIRMWISRKKYLDVTQNEIDHIQLECLIRVHKNNPFEVRFMYTYENGGHFQEMTSDIFKLRTYLIEINNYRTRAVVQVLGRLDGEDLPTRFTCDVFTDSQISGYGYETIRVNWFTQIVEPTYYWTKFFDSGPPTDGDESETKGDHQSLANADGYDLLCNSPVYAECRVKPASSEGVSIQWYDAAPIFVPDEDYPCSGRGIRCSSTDAEGNAQSCPDLEVRYACKTPPAPDTVETTLSTSTTEYTSDAISPVRPNVSSTHPSSNDSTSSGSGSDPPSQQPAGGQSGGNNVNGGNTKNTFAKTIKDNLNWIYPVTIVVLGIGVPVVISCYFLLRKKTPEEIEEASKKLAALKDNRR